METIIVAALRCFIIPCIILFALLSFREDALAVSNAFMQHTLNEIFIALETAGLSSELSSGTSSGFPAHPGAKFVRPGETPSSLATSGASFGAAVQPGAKFLRP